MKNYDHKVCEENTYKALFHQFGEKLFQFLYYKFKNEDLARDCMQESFIILWENCKDVTVERAKNYVFTVGRNKAIDLIRREKLHLTIENDDRNLIQEEITEEDPEKSKKMAYILAKIPLTSREAFLMNRINDMTYAEIAKELEISVKAVEKRMSIALKVIREEIVLQRR